MSVIKVGAEREQVFDRTLRYDRQNDYDINKYEIKEFDFKAGHRQVYGNFNFSIFIDEFCNADCKFCVAQLRYENKKLLYHKEHLPDDIWLKRCEEILKLVRPLNPSISITGGEPTLSKKLVPVLQMVDALGFRKRTITTNGSYLFHKVDGLPIIDHLIRNHWDHLNISRPSISDADARSIMRFSNEYNFTSNEMVRDILAEANKSSLKHRLSCLLLKEGVNSVDMMKAYVDTYMALGANNFIFRELMDYDTTAVNVEKMEYCQSNKVRLNDIWEQFDGRTDFIPWLNILGYYYYVEIYKYGNAVVASESANLNQQTVEVAKHPNMVYEMVFHTNGNLCASWIDKERILDKYGE